MSISHSSLLPPVADLLRQASENNTGRRDWREWKQDQGQALADMISAAERMSLLDLCLDGDFNAVVAIRMPVPRWPKNGRLRIGHRAVFHLHYEDRWRWEAPAGWMPLGIFEPPDIFAPNMAPSLRGAICLGKTLPAGIPVTEIIVLGYYAVTLQNRDMDETDPAGVLNVQACEFFRNRPEYLPLTDAGLFEDWEPDPKETQQ